MKTIINEEKNYKRLKEDIRMIKRQRSDAKKNLLKKVKDLESIR